MENKKKEFSLQKGVWIDDLNCLRLSKSLSPNAWCLVNYSNSLIKIAISNGKKRKDYYPIRKETVRKFLAKGRGWSTREFRRNLKILEDNGVILRTHHTYTWNEQGIRNLLNGEIPPAKINKTLEDIFKEKDPKWKPKQD